MFDHLNGERYPDIKLAKKDGGDANNHYPNISSCLELESGVFDHSHLPDKPHYEQVPHFQRWKMRSGMAWGWCPSDDIAIIYASNDADRMNHVINTMPLHGGTGTQYAMKWALALLNPTSQPAFSLMAADNLIPAGFATRPAAWNDPETVKYIVLMTDGRVSSQLRPKVPMDLRNPTMELRGKREKDRIETVSRSISHSQFQKQCNLAKTSNRNVIVYTIAFDALNSGSIQNEMKQCASSPSHFFNADTNDVEKVFINIARQINELKLVK